MQDKIQGALFGKVGAKLADLFKPENNTPFTNLLKNKFKLNTSNNDISNLISNSSNLNPAVLNLNNKLNNLNEFINLSTFDDPKNTIT